jgi:hypothetical protein
MRLLNNVDNFTILFMKNLLIKKIDQIEKADFFWYTTIIYMLFPECIENHAVSLALLLIYIDFDRKVLKKV